MADRNHEMLLTIAAHARRECQSVYIIRMYVRSVQDNVMRWLLNIPVKYNNNT